MPPALSLMIPRFSRIRQMVSLVRLRPFDTSNEAGRAAERHRRLALTGIASLVARVLSTPITFITMRLTLEYLQAERNGMWLTMSSMVAMLAFADLGLGSGLMNVVADAWGRNDRHAAAKYVSSAFFLLGSIAFTLFLALLAIYPFISWPKIFNVTSPQAMREAGPGLAVFVACFVVNLPLAVISRVQMAHQEGFVPAAAAIGGSVFGLVALLGVMHLGLSLPWVILATSGTPLLATLLSSIPLLLHKPWLIPKPGNVQRAAVSKLLNTGLLFLVLQVVGNIAFLSDNLVATQVLGSASVTRYNYPFRLFMLPSILITMTSGALWPVYAEAITRGDIAWVRRTFYRSMRMAAGIGIAAGLVLLIFNRQLLYLWVQDRVPPPGWMLATGLAAWLVLFSIASTMSMLLNGLNVVKFQIVSSVLMAGFNLALSIILARRIGVAGLIWGTVIAYTLFEFIPRIWYIPRLLAGLQKNPGAVVAGTLHNAPAQIE